MQIVVVKQDRLQKYPFPNENISMYWIKDFDNNFNEINIAAIERKNNKWMLLSSEVSQIDIGGNLVDETVISLNKFYKLNIKNKGSKNISNALIYVCDENDVTYTSYEILKDGQYTIGVNATQDIIINGEYIEQEHAILEKSGHNYVIKAKTINTNIYVNKSRVNSKAIENGDIIFIYGYRFIVINDYLIINSVNNGLKVNSSNIKEKELPKFSGELLKTEDNDNAVLYSENDYFSRQPRFVTSVVPEDLRIDNPPGQVVKDDTPVLFTVGPMLTMSMSSVVSASTSVITLMNGNGSIVSALPTIIISLVMLCSTILWPTLTRKYNEKKQDKQEKERQKKYIEYLKEKKLKIDNLRTNQYQILISNYPEPKGIETIITNRKRNLWERQIDSDDFLTVRLGLGTIPLKVNINYSQEEFTMTTDNLKEELLKVAEGAKDIPNAPVTVSLTNVNKLVIIGNDYYKESMLKSMILQLSTYQSYNDLKLVFMISDMSQDIFSNFKLLPHVWSNARDIRYFANNYDDMTKISFHLEQVYMSRKYSDEEGTQVSEINYRNVRPYYLIITDNIKKNQNVEIINKILKEEQNLGFGLIILNDGIANLPNECNDFLTVAGEKSAIIKNDLNKENQQTFVMDRTDNLELAKMCELLSNIPIKLPLMLDEMKNSIGFLEMYKVGRVEQLNIVDRWINNNPVNSLSVPIGIHTDGELFNLDLHEKFHGPHGLIAGMTGSGKSEFIITFILSMCINFNPSEVSFVLIDYKGGGLTGAFENKMTGVKLPHLAGTITNLDKAEINRSLSSIQSELRRRQTLFNKAKMKLNESTIDIYKYQKLYRDGAIDTPISHLFIISDEFAELKSQQPDFMNELISTARIGRSLGVHLILATQKPSGIVDDQIWSNSKFKVCLKVQEKADSMDVIKCPDAAMLKRVGRFYLQVGYNDYFAMGQAAYAGVKYIPRDKITKTVDRNVSFINDIGDTIKSMETSKSIELASFGEELPNILQYIVKAADDKSLVADKLWLDPIPKEIFVNNLIKKYNFKPEKWHLKAIIGEYDDPNNQKQALLTLDFKDSANTLIYGVDGKEIMLSSIIYSLIISHMPEEINIYVIDFGTEMFNIFKDAPQVGDVIFLTEEEKLVNLFNTLMGELERRKKLFVDYNGDYDLYIKNSGKTLPKYIIVLNNYEIFTENYEDYVDVLSGLSREGEKYGITFIISATGVNAVRGKTSQNFNNILCLQFNDSTDYSSVLGATRGMVPSAILGRGLVKIDGTIYEFQTAYPYKWDEINVFIKSVCQRLKTAITSKAKKIRTLPIHVRIDNILSTIGDLRNVPVGIEKDSLAVATFDFAKTPISLVSAQDATLLDNFVPSLGQVLRKVNNCEFYMVDCGSLVKDYQEYGENYLSDPKVFLDKFKNIPIIDNTKYIVFMLYGLDSLYNGLVSSEQMEFKSLLNNLKNRKNIKVIFADAVSRIKTFEYEEFYKNNVQSMYGVWIGSGINDQFTIKSSTYTKVTRGQLPNGFGFNIIRSNATLIKVLDFYTKDE